MPKAVTLITKYFKSKLSTKVFAIPSPEGYRNATEKGYGIRFYIPKGNRSIRLNWSKPNSIGMVGVVSADIWIDSPMPYHVAFDEKISLVKTLPFVTDLLMQGQRLRPHRSMTAPDGVDPLNESMEYLEEAADPADAFDGIVAMLSDPNFSKSKIWSAYKGTGMKIFDAITAMFPSAVTKKGTSYAWVGSAADITAINKAKSTILSSSGSVAATISRATGKEKYSVDPAVKHIEDNMERLSFEKQIEDLESLVKLTINGSSNALFVAGRGGVGKTHTVEKVLAAQGLQDGKGYFKSTGSASAAGIYSLMFAHKDDVLLFDDSDDALGDQQARNIFKAATDTKKVRKLVWNKMGKNIVEPDSMSAEEMIDQGLLPRYFEFTGKVIFISNLPLQKLDPDGAIRTRAYIIDINPTEVEVYDFMEKIADDIPLADGLTLSSADRKRVITLLRNGKSKQSANLRKLSRGLSMAAAGGDISDSDLARMISTYA
jgi:hypothetical protein